MQKPFVSMNSHILTLQLMYKYQYNFVLPKDYTKLLGKFYFNPHYSVGQK